MLQKVKSTYAAIALDVKEKSQINFHKISLYIVLLFLTIDIFLYQGKYQINNIVFILSLVLFISFYFFLIKKKSFDKMILLLTAFMFSFAIFTANFNKNEFINITIMTLLSYSAFFSLFCFGSTVYRKIKLSSLFKIYFLLPFPLATISLFSDYRQIFPNPNWCALWFLYSFFMFVIFFDLQKKLRFVVLSLCIYFFIFYFAFESRGSSLMILSLLVFLFMNNFFSYKIKKYFYALFVLFGVLALHLIIQSLAQNIAHKEIMILLTARGMGGREVALIPAYNKIFVENSMGILGFGPWMSGSFGHSELNPKGVHIHFSFYEMILKFSIIFFAIIFYWLNSIWQKILNSNIKNKNFYLGMVLSLTLTIFFYNGFGPSHYGINAFQFFLLGLLKGKLKKRRSRKC